MTPEADAPRMQHVHDCSGPTMTCACGYTFRVPPICVEINVFDRDRLLVNEGFNCETLAGAIRALIQAADRLRNSS